MPMMTLFRNLPRRTTRGRRRREGARTEWATRASASSFVSAAGETLHPNWPPPWHDSTRKAADSTPPLLEATPPRTFEKTTTISSSSSSGLLNLLWRRKASNEEFLKNLPSRMGGIIVCILETKTKKISTKMSFVTFYALCATLKLWDVSSDE